MTAIIPATTYVRPDEPCYLILEMNQMPPEGTEDHRYQLVYVVRDDLIAEYRADLGPASLYDAPQFRILTLLEHTVAEAQDMAERDRLANDYWVKRTAELSAESTLIKDAINQWEENAKIAFNRSIFGPSVTKQRNGFDTKEAQAQWRRRN